MFNRGHYKKLVEDEKGPRVGAVNAKGEPTYALDGADEKTFTTDFLADRAIEFIRRNKGKPFCYVVSIPDPHGPNTVRAPYDTMYLNLPFQQPRTAQSKGQNLPPYAATLAGRFNKAQMALYFGMVKCIDDNVGRMMAALRETGALDNTVIVFTSDHGDLCGEHGRDNKGVPMEASARIPFILRAPGTVKPGTVVHEALSSVDFKPTVLSLMGIADPVKTEGRDASPLFTGKRPASGWNDIAFVRIGGGSQRAAAADEDGESAGNGWMGAFNSRFKLIVAPGAAPGLFDLHNDPDELHNVFAEPAHRATVKQLGTSLLDYARQHKDPHLGTPNVRADLEWATTGTGPYTPATSAEAAPVGGKAKGKKAKAKQD